MNEYIFENVMIPNLEIHIKASTFLDAVDVLKIVTGNVEDYFYLANKSIVLG